MKKIVITMVLGALLSTWGVITVVPVINLQNEVGIQPDSVMSGYPRSDEEWD